MLRTSAPLRHPQPHTRGRTPLAPQLNVASHPLPVDHIPAAVLDRLAAEGVTTLEAWRALGSRRHQVWGVTRRVAEKLDALVRGPRS
jgi:hypothetical protein